jgi:hypothetical protein
MKRILVTALHVSLGATMWCQMAQANVATMSIKVQAPELSGEVQMEDGGPVAGATVQLCEKEWKNCTASISTDTSGKFRFEAMKPKQVNYLLIKWPGANWVTAEVRINKKAKPLVVKLHLE